MTDFSVLRITAAVFLGAATGLAILHSIVNQPIIKRSAETPPIFENKEEKPPFSVKTNRDPKLNPIVVKRSSLGSMFPKQIEDKVLETCGWPSEYVTIYYRELAGKISYSIPDSPAVLCSGSAEWIP